MSRETARDWNLPALASNLKARLNGAEDGPKQKEGFANGY
jgi:hypothetical protein